MKGPRSFFFSNDDDLSLTYETRSRSLLTRLCSGQSRFSNLCHYAVPALCLQPVPCKARRRKPWSQGIKQSGLSDLTPVLNLHACSPRCTLICCCVLYCCLQLRGENDELFTGAKNSATVGWRIVLEKMGLSGKVTPAQAKKKWDNLKKKYKECKYPGSGEGVSGKPTAATWPWFVQMDEVLGQRPSICPPVLIASIPMDTPLFYFFFGGWKGLNFVHC
ncbi:hypothetical protein QQF64_022427 [Cirrhinus molitorella]|uniref:Myb/SANT-like DNA-binding domain-containing protein n=1 Tax=Cirrhinus molitorella TaxID=172907 RepID=A0ABR3L849_9TELE